MTHTHAIHYHLLLLLKLLLLIAASSQLNPIQKESFNVQLCSKGKCTSVMRAANRRTLNKEKIIEMYMHA